MREYTLKGEKIVHSKEIVPEGYKRRIDFERSLEYLEDFKQVLDLLKIPFFLFCGTMIGAYRDDDFVEYDHDADIAVLSKHMSFEQMEEVKRLMVEKGYHIGGNHKFLDKCTSFYPAKYGHNEKVDLYILYFKDPHYYFVSHLHSQAHPKGYYGIPYPKKHFDKLDKITFKGIEFNIPSDVEELLEYMWGKWWIAIGGNLGIVPYQAIKEEEFS